MDVKAGIAANPAATAIRSMTIFASLKKPRKKFLLGFSLSSSLPIRGSLPQRGGVAYDG